MHFRMHLSANSVSASLSILLSSQNKSSRFEPEARTQETVVILLYHRLVSKMLIMDTQQV